jgi:hypothetical protein
VPVRVHRGAVRHGEEAARISIHTHGCASCPVGCFGPDTASGGVEMRFVARSDGRGAIVDVRMESDEANAGSLQTALVRLELEAAAVDTFAAALRQLDSCKRGVAVLRHGCG